MIRFDYPELLLLAIPLWFLLRRIGWASGPTGWLRVGILLTLLLAISIPRWNTAGQGTDIIVVVDRSRSMPANTEQSIRDLIKDLEDNRGAGDRIAIVSFGSNAEIERELSETAVLGEFNKEVSRDGSDLNEAILTALDRRNNPDRPARVVVLSDGVYNGPSPLYAARRAREQEVPIDFREFAKPIAGDLAIDSIMLPQEVAPNEAFQFSVFAYADRDAEATVVVMRNGVEIARRDTSLVLGMNRLMFRDWVEEGGMHQYSAVLLVNDDVGKDPIPENDTASSVMRVKAGQRLLLVTDDGLPGNIGRALESGQIAFDVVRPSDSTMTLDALDRYRAVILENVSANSLGRVRMERLRQFVEDLGGGLLMTGGRQSFGTGGYYKSPLDEILPVAMHSLEETRRSRAAIVIVLDRSGSMAAPAGGGKTKMQLANIGTAECVRMLMPDDMISVIAVDSAPHVIQEITKCTDPESIARRSLAIQSMGGGIYVYDGLIAAGKQLMKAEKYNTRHIILFSDAQDSEQPGDYKNLIKKFNNAGITISVIGLGTPADVDAAFLRDIAKRGNGNIEFTNDPLDLPRLFTQDTMNMTRNMFLTRESEEQPAGFAANIVGGFQLIGAMDANQVPAVFGYNLTFVKPDATIGAVSSDENAAPFTAFWYRGLGRAAAMPIEMDGEFSGNLAKWDQYESWVNSHARWLLGDKGSQDVFVSLRQDGLDAVVQVELDPNRPNEKRGQTPTLVVVPPDDERAEVITPEFVWTGPDTLEGRFRMEKTGTWRTLVKTDQNEMTQGPALSLPYSPEFMPREGMPSGHATLVSIAELTGGTGRVNLLELLQQQPKPSRSLRSLVPWLCLFAICLLVIEIMGRRWSLWDRFLVWQNEKNRSAKKKEKAAITDTSSTARTKKQKLKKRAAKQPKQTEPTAGPPAAQDSTLEEATEPEPSSADVFARAKRPRQKTQPITPATGIRLNPLIGKAFQNSLGFCYLHRFCYRSARSFRSQYLGEKTYWVSIGRGAFIIVGSAKYRYARRLEEQLAQSLLARTLPWIKLLLEATDVDARF